MRQNMVFSVKNTKKKFLGRGTAPLQTPPSVGGDTPSPHPTHLGACGTSTPPILKSWVPH